MRLIDADALKKALNEAWEDNVLSTLGDAVNIITNAPTVQREGWVSVEDRLPELHKKGNWKISNRCVVLVNRRGAIYEAFATLEGYLSTGVAWSIEGHNGDWHKNVTHWFQIPALPAAPKE